MIDVGSANVRASELVSYASRLQSAKSTLEQYQSMIRSNWQATEVAYYMAAIDRAQSRLQQASNELEFIASSVSSTARQIRAEEEAEERKRREAEERARREEEEAREREEAAEREQKASAARTATRR